MIACLMLQGFGLGAYQVAYSDLVVAALPITQRGVAGSLTMVTRTVGVVLGASLLTWLLQIAENAALAGGAGTQTAFMAGFRAVFLGAAEPRCCSSPPARCGTAPGRSVRPGLRLRRGSRKRPPRR